MDDELKIYRDAIERTFSELRGAPMSLLTEGWDSVGVDVDDRLIFKFPRDEDAERALVREHAILSIVRPAIGLLVPELHLHDGPPLFSRHKKIPGEHLLTADYERLGGAPRSRLGQQLGRFYAELHALDQQLFAGLPPVQFDPEPTPDEILSGLEQVLPAELRGFAERSIAEWRTLPPDPHGTVFGFFDGHGWNMAFDRTTGVLNGIYDFADARFGPLQKDFIYSNFVSRDLTARIIDAYETITGRPIDRHRVELLTSVQFISEVAGWETYPEKLPKMIETLRAWAAG
jgi:hypothetical protein